LQHGQLLLVRVELAVHQRVVLLEVMVQTQEFLQQEQVTGHQVVAVVELLPVVVPPLVRADQVAPVAVVAEMVIRVV
jgi:ABC-type molybdate transport system permease subunit